MELCKIPELCKPHLNSQISVSTVHCSQFCEYSICKTIHLSGDISTGQSKSGFIRPNNGRLGLCINDDLGTGLYAGPNVCQGHMLWLTTVKLIYKL